MLAGVAIGDALGMPAEFLTPDTIVAWYGQINGFIEPHPEHPHYGLPVGSVTDDTDQTLIIAQLLIDKHVILFPELAKRLLIWSETPRVIEHKFVGPSTHKTLAALKEGLSVDQVPRSGTSVGAAMRVAPIAISFPDRQQLTEQVVTSCAVSHFTRNAISGAMAMAFALGEALQPSADLQSIAYAAQEGAILGRNYGDWSWSPPIERRIDHVLAWVDNLQENEVLTRLYEVIGVDLFPEQLLPCAIGLAFLSRGDPMRAMILAANLGGDTDTLASMVGSICGGLRGINGFDENLLARVKVVNQLNLREIAMKLTTMRRGRH